MSKRISLKDIMSRINKDREVVENFGKPNFGQSERRAAKRKRSNSEIVPKDGRK